MELTGLQKDGIAARLANNPVVRFMGIELLAVTVGHATLMQPYREELRNSMGLVQGGILGTLADVAGGTPQVNVQITRDVLAGEKGAPRDIVVLNAAATLLIGRVVRSLREGIGQAEEAIDSGAAARKLEQLIGFTQAAVAAETKARS